MSSFVNQKPLLDEVSDLDSELEHNIAEAKSQQNDGNPSPHKIDRAHIQRIVQKQASNDLCLTKVKSEKVLPMLKNAPIKSNKSHTRVNSKNNMVPTDRSIDHKNSDILAYSDPKFSIKMRRTFF